MQPDASHRHARARQPSEPAVNRLLRPGSRLKTHSAPHGTLLAFVCVHGRLPNFKQCDPCQETYHTACWFIIDSVSSSRTSKIHKHTRKLSNGSTIARSGALTKSPEQPGVLRQYVSRNRTRVFAMAGVQSLKSTDKRGHKNGYLLVAMYVCMPSSCRVRPRRQFFGFS
jgi:hypothetical protein